MTTPAVQVTAVATAAATPWWADYVKAVMAASLGAAGTIGASWLGKRTHPKALQADISDKLSASFQRLVDELQEDNARLNKRLDLLRDESHGLRNKLTRLQAFARMVFEHIGVLEMQLRGAGLEPTARPDLPDPATLN